MSAANARNTQPDDTPHAAPDYHDSGEHLAGSAEDVIAHIGATSTAERSDRVDHFDDGAEDTTRVG
ncbi:MAG: hypothetical protein JWN61_1033 [Pseudonocardiales bacterium]|nr:hypothetical protein [Jatrophihabitantaceae bacterium]MCW2602898.1 hypothetical protein [Pseudonocardiales bacterium]